MTERLITDKKVNKLLTSEKCNFCGDINDIQVYRCEEDENFYVFRFCPCCGRHLSRKRDPLKNTILEMMDKLVKNKA